LLAWFSCSGVGNAMPTFSAVVTAVNGKPVEPTKTISVEPLDVVRVELRFELDESDIVSAVSIPQIFDHGILTLRGPNAGPTFHQTCTPTGSPCAMYQPGYHPSGNATTDEQAEGSVGAMGFLSTPLGSSTAQVPSSGSLGVVDFCVVNASRATVRPFVRFPQDGAFHVFQAEEYVVDPVAYEIGDGVTINPDGPVSPPAPRLPPGEPAPVPAGAHLVANGLEPGCSPETNLWKSDATLPEGSQYLIVHNARCSRTRTGRAGKSTCDQPQRHPKTSFAAVGFSAPKLSADVDGHSELALFDTRIANAFAFGESTLRIDGASETSLHGLGSSILRVGGSGEPVIPVLELRERSNLLLASGKIVQLGVADDSEAIIESGVVGETRLEGGDVKMYGGQIARLGVTGGRALLAGGRVEELSVAAGGEASLRGAGFAIDGVPTSGPVRPTEGVLSGVWPSGEEFEIRFERAGEIVLTADAE